MYDNIACLIQLKREFIDSLVLKTAKSQKWKNEKIVILSFLFYYTTDPLFIDINWYIYI